jgi:hypothetical protein
VTMKRMMEKRAKPQGFRICLVLITALLGASSLISCETYSAVQIQQPLEKSKPHKIRIERCTDRTDYKGKHNLAEEATRALIDKLEDSGLFEIAPEAQFVFTCDIERFAEGSAFKRWLMPGLGATQAEVVVMVWERPGEKVLAEFRSESAVKMGGLYTIGADQYIFGAVFDEIVDQLKVWVTSGESKSQ